MEQLAKKLTKGTFVCFKEAIKPKKEETSAAKKARKRLRRTAVIALVSKRVTFETENIFSKARRVKSPVLGSKKAKTAIAKIGSSAMTIIKIRKENSAMPLNDEKLNFERGSLLDFWETECFFEK